MPVDRYADFVIQRDTREPHPYGFLEQYELPAAQIVDQVMKTGDYGIWKPGGGEPEAVVERKTLPDFIGSVCDKRIWEQAARLFEIEYAAVVIEATWEEIIKGKWKHSQMNPAALSGCVIKLQQDYGLTVHIGGKREFAEYWAYKYLRKAWFRLTEKERKTPAFAPNVSGAMPDLAKMK